MGRFIAFIALLFIAEAYSGEIFEYHNTTRALGMGNAFIAIASGYDSIYYNPAGITKKQDIKNKVQIAPIVLDAGLNWPLISFMKKEPGSLFGLQKLINALTQKPGNNFHFYASYNPYIIMENFAFGLLAQQTTNAMITKDDPPNLQMGFISDISLNTGVGIKFFGGILKIGAAAKLLWRGQIIKDYTPEEYQNMSFSNSLAEGVGAGVDAGIILTAPIKLLPSIGVSYMNIGKTRFTLRRGLLSNAPRAAGRPNDLPNQLHVGVGIQPILSPQVRLRVDIDYRDVLNNNYDYLKKIHGGLEFEFFKILFLRAGANQGYWTVGLGVQAGGAGLEYACYGEDIGANKGSRKEDRRHVFMYSLSF